jgi:hypothetical protein
MDSFANTWPHYTLMYYVCNGVTLIERPSVPVASRRHGCIDAHAGN